METQIKLIIADDEPFICGLLEKLVDFDALGLTLIACANDGVTLEKEIETMQPDIVLTDISMPKQDGLDVIRKTREKGIDCRFIIISGYRQFEYAYNALKYNVDDYLLKPVEKNELNQVLKKICSEIRHIAQGEDNAEMVRQHAYLIEKGIHKELRNDSLSIQQINQIFYTHFVPGAFRVVMLKLDFTRDEKQWMEDVSSVINKLRNIGCQFLQQSCNEVVYSEQRDRVVFLLNYNLSAGNGLKRIFSDIYTEAKHIVDLFHGFNLTLCVGKQVEQLYWVETSKISCLRACWIRMHYGINRMIYSEEVEDPEIAGFRVYLGNIKGNLEKAYTSIDIEAMEREFEQFFSLPVPVLCSTECMNFVQDSVRFLCEKYGMATKGSVNTENSFEAINAELELQITFRNYEAVLTKQIGKYMEKMSDFIREKNAKPVLRACAYIEAHYAEHITLETMANLVNLNPIYFSNLFKRETGQNFTEYLTDYRMKVAKEMLRSSDRNINEIADALGYADARYFSKVFKKEVGVKPTDYRKIYG